MEGGLRGAASLSPLGSRAGAELVYVKYLLLHEGPQQEPDVYKNVF